MKKIFAMVSSLLVGVGLRAQTPTPIVKKETQKQPVLKPNVTISQTDSSKAGYIKHHPIPNKIGHEGHIKNIKTSHYKSPTIKG